MGWKLFSGELMNIRAVGVQYQMYDTLVEFIDGKTGLFQLCLTQRICELKENETNASARSMLTLMIAVVSKINALITDHIIDSRRVPRFNRLYAKVKKTRSIKPMFEALL